MPIYTNPQSAEDAYDTEMDGDFFTAPVEVESGKGKPRTETLPTDADPNDEAWEEVDSALSQDPNGDDDWDDDNTPQENEPDARPGGDDDDIPPHTDKTEEPAASQWVGIAVELGIDEDYATKLDKAGLLHETVRREMRRQKEHAVPTPESSEPSTQSEEDFLQALGITEDDYDPAIIKAFRALRDEHKSEVSRLQETLNQQQQTQYYAWFDDQISELGSEFKDVLGEGTGADLRQDSPQFQKRVELLEEMETLRDVHARKGRAVSNKALFDRALKNILGNDVERGQLKQQLKTRSSQRSTRPTKRNQDTTPRTGAEKRDRMLHELQEKMAEFGLVEDQYGRVNKP